MRNPVMFVVEITAVLVTILIALNLTGAARVEGPAGLGFQVQIAAWLWFTVLFATYAEAVAEARGRAQAASLRKTRSESTAHRRREDGTLEDVGSSELRRGDIIVVREGETIPGDGDVIEGVGLRQRGGDHGRIGARCSRSRAPTSAARSPAARSSSVTSWSSASPPTRARPSSTG